VSGTIFGQISGWHEVSVHSSSVITQYSNSKLYIEMGYFRLLPKTSHFALKNQNLIIFGIIEFLGFVHRLLFSRTQRFENYLFLSSGERVASAYAFGSARKS
jgi:hypothetical protein